jgi:hypothetical protein
MSAKDDIPEGDRKLFDADAWLSAAVALDVLSTLLGELDNAGLQTPDVVHATVELGLMGGLDGEEVDNLLAVAKSAVGDARAAIAPLLVNPRDVQRAVRLVRDGARTLVREARLELEAAAVTAYKQV